MWDSETERIGKQRCTRLGYWLHGISDLIGFVGLIILVSMAGYLSYRGLAGTFRTGLLRMLLIPFALAIFGGVLYQVSWIIARRKKFHYDYETGEASWEENGQKRFYKYSAEGP
jgi:hypothetical protein